VSSSRVLGRIPDMPRQGRKGSQYGGFPEGDKGNLTAALITRLDTASDEVGMSPEYPNGTSWLRDRLGSHTFLHSALKNSQDTWHRASYPPAGLARETVGFKGQVTIFCGVFVLLSLAMPFASFYTRSLLEDMTRRPRESRASRNGNRCR
jgi:hypothetical protein